MELHVNDISHVIQLSVAPVFLLTSIATMINAMNTRLGRIVDRRRKVLEQRRGENSAVDEECDLELRTLSQRAHLSYLGIFFAVLSALLICLVMIGAFLGALISVDLSKGVAIVFILALCAVIGALGLFLREVYLGVSVGTHVTH
ncbi:DUF2721 domain-containing protein [uncultured Propionivibrio sp.]|uniref:DUF2721 domain-containing protein n=1 Tax=uncultured Propionivibrio sp. TaxID=426737 RepID=UPI0029C06004|nr:DUF2721 domain-containing protein [uncultured Propionivibrio sp.]